MERKRILEVCCGSLEDAKTAYQGGADRIELNSALYLGGLTPSMASLSLTKQECRIPVVVMVRPRGSGFCYSEDEYKTMWYDARLLMELGADGIAFGFLNGGQKLDADRTADFVELVHAYGKEAVFHRAFDCIDDWEEAAEQLIYTGVDRILTSGGRASAWDGRERLKKLHERFGNRISILPGSGIRSHNAKELMEYTGIGQIHSSCGGFKTDSTASAQAVSFSYTPDDRKNQYETVLIEHVRELRERLKG